MSIAFLQKTIITMGDGDVMTGIAICEGANGLYIMTQLPKAQAPGTPAPAEFAAIARPADADVIVQFADSAAVGRMIADLVQLQGKMIADSQTGYQCQACHDRLCGGTGVYEGRKCDGIPF